MRAISEVFAQSWPQEGLSDLLRRFGRGRPACAPMGWGSRLNPKYRRSFRLWAVLVLAFPSLAWSPAWGADPPVASEVGQRTAQLLAELIRIPTVNPPGGEERLAERLAAELAGAGLETRVIPTPRADPSDPARAAVWARLPGRGIQPPLILLSHLDVVPADPSAWQHPPFAGVIENSSPTATLFFSPLPMRRLGAEPEPNTSFANTPNFSQGPSSCSPKAGVSGRPGPNAKACVRSRPCGA